MNIHLRKYRSARKGVLKTEAILSMFLLVAAMNVASPMIHRVNMLWKDTQKHQFAINELSNQMDALVSQSPDQVDKALESLEVSEACKETLDEVTLSGSVTSDDLGTRVTLELMWQKMENARPVTLSAWLSDPGEATNPDNSGEGERP